MSTDNGLSAGQVMGHRPIFVDPSSNCLCTTNPANGQIVWIVDPETGQPLTARQVYSDPASGCLCSVDPATNKVSWIIDPATGRPMIGPQAQAAAPVVQEVVEEAAEPAQVGEPWLPAVDEPVQQPFEEPAQFVGAPVQAAVEEPWLPVADDPAQQPLSEPVPAVADEPFDPVAEGAIQNLVDEPWIPAAEQTAQQPAETLLSANGEVIEPQPVLAPEPSVQPEPAPPAQPAPTPAPAANAQPAVGIPAPARPEPAPAPILMPAKKSTSVMAVFSLVMGLLAVAAAVAPLFVDLASVIPGGKTAMVRSIVDNAAFGFAIIGLVFALIGTHGIQAGKKRGKGMAIAGVLLCVLSVVAVLMTQYLFPKAVDGVLGRTRGVPVTSVQQSVAEPVVFDYHTTVD